MIYLDIVNIGCFNASVYKIYVAYNKIFNADESLIGF